MNTTYYKHKETGEIYDKNGYSHIHNEITLKFYPFNNSLKPIVITTPDIVDTEQIYTQKGICQEYTDALKKNDANAIANALNTFDKIELNIKREINDTIIPGVYKMTYYCPLCGSKMEHRGGAYLTSPLQYDSFCVNDDCGFYICTARWHSGSLVCGTDKNEIERIINSGTPEEKKELCDYSKEMLKYVDIKE